MSPFCFAELTAKQKHSISASPLRPLPALLNAGEAGPAKQDLTGAPLRFTILAP